MASYIYLYNFTYLLYVVTYLSTPFEYVGKEKERENYFIKTNGRIYEIYWEGVRKFNEREKKKIILNNND